MAPIPPTNPIGSAIDGASGFFRRRAVAVAFIIATQVFVPSTWAEPQTLEGLKIELVAEESIVRPGVPFTVGLLIDHATGYHTYWKNPGIVGVPTKVVWDLPDGFVAGDIQWPEPQLTKMAIYPVYGYEGKTLLPVTITPPQTLDPSDTPEVTLKAETSWMCCAKTCHPGFSTFSITLPTAAVAEPSTATDHKQAFDAARAALPLETDAWQISAIRTGDRISAEVRPTAGGAANITWLSSPVADNGIYFFSGDGLIDSTANQEVTILPGGSGFKVSLTVSKYAPKAPPEGPRLVGVLAGKKPWLNGAKATSIEVNTVLSRSPEPDQEPISR